MFLADLLKKKVISVWGLGYLGYTSILKFQDSGFHILAYDFNFTKMKHLLKGQYPNKEQVVSWSQTGYVPQIDPMRIKITDRPEALFRDSLLHIIAIPEHYTDDRESVASKLAELFCRHLTRSRIKPLILFESAHTPGHIEKQFIGYLKAKKIYCPRDYFIGAWFRTDWNIEAFVSQKDKMPIAGHDAKSLDMMRQLMGYLKAGVIELEGLREAEVYINSINTIQAMVNDFVRQLSFGYNSVNLKKLSEYIFRNIKLDDCDLNLGTGGTKMTLAVDNLIKGSDNPGCLTLLKEFQDINISSVLNYGEYIIRQGYKSAAILGLTYKGNQKDTTLSPSVTLADYLVKNSVKVRINDPLFTYKEINRFIKGAKAASFPKEVFSVDCLILATDHNEYKKLSQRDVDSITKKPKLIIDNYGVWSGLSFGNKVKYHQVGDGSLPILKK